MIALVLALVLQGKTERSEGATDLVLRFLAGHQRADGSWGERPEGCSCPGEKKASACPPGKVAPLLSALGDEDPGKRDAAEKELRALGESALPHLRAALEDRDPEVRGRCARLCRPFDLAARGGGDAELTGLALLTFLGAGFSQLSKDDRQDYNFGPVVKKGIAWLVERQKETGAFDAKDATADAIASLALSEDFGMTANEILRDPAQKGIDRAAASSPEATRGLIWKGMALKSAELADLHFPKKAYEDLYQAIAARDGEIGVAGYTLLSIFIKKTKADGRLARIRTLNPALLETETLYFGNLAIFQYDGPSGGGWTAWNGPIKERLLSAQRREKGACERGSWDGQGYRGRLRGTALNGMNFEIYYAYSLPK